MSIDVLLIHLGRTGAKGAMRRVESWLEILAEAGLSVVSLPLLTECRPSVADSLDGAIALRRGDKVPEALSWSTPAVIGAIRKHRPHALVCVTSRAFDRRFCDHAAVVVVDFVDRLSESYRYRARVSGGASRPLLRLLAAAQERFEASELPPSVRRVAAGYSDAAILDATWIPVTSSPQPARSDQIRSHDLLFVGTLSYPPNVAALRRLARLWPEMGRRRPALTLLVAGSNPTREVTRLAEASGWALRSPFASFADLANNAGLAVAPLEFATGIQIKVLDAAAAGMPQLVSSVALAGFAPGFPVQVADEDAAFVDGVGRLLGDPVGALQVAEAAREDALARYSPVAWVTAAAEILA